MSSDYRPRLVADQSLPYLAGLLDAVADVTYLPSQEITRKRLIEEKAEGLLIRSVTRCNQSLLEGTSIRSIATATAGFDHIDRDYCSSHGILWRNSPGCNARSVAHWVMGVLAERALRLKRPLAQETLAIIGVGHVGGNVQQMAEALGIKTLLVDPPRAEHEGVEGFSTLEEVAHEATIITFHTPLTKEGKYPTYHLLGEEFLQQCRKRPLILNAARGAIADSDALLRALNSDRIEAFYLDCWEGEPDIRLDVLTQAERATPHIAGFSADGKARGTRMAVETTLEHFGLDASLIPFERISLPTPESATIDLHSVSALRPEWVLAHTMKGLSHIEQALRQTPEQFESLRVHYDYPREAPAYRLLGVLPEEKQLFHALGYAIA